MCIFTVGWVAFKFFEIIVGSTVDTVCLAK